MRRAVEGVLALGLFAAVCASATSWVLSYQFADDDTGEAVRLARSCIELGQCRGMGTHTSVLGLGHGASWIRLIAYFLRSGGGLSALQIALLALLIASAAVSFLVVRRYASSRAALVALLLYMQPIIATTRFMELSNTTLLPLALALYYASVALCVESGSWVAGAVGSICLVAAVGGHVTCLLLVPFHVGLVALFARRARAAVTIACLAFAIPFALESTDVADAIAGLIINTPAVLALLVTAAVLLGVRPLRQRLVSLLAMARPHMRRVRAQLAALPVRLRVLAVMKTAVVYFSAAVWSASILVGRTLPDGHYFAPLVFPLVFLAADSTAQLSRRALIVLWTIGLLALVAFPFAPLMPNLGCILILVLSGLAAFTAIAWARRRAAWLFGSDPLAPPPTAFAFVLAGIVLAASLPDLLIVPRVRESWPVAASEQLTRRMYESGITFPQLMASLQRQSPGTIEHMMEIRDPDLFGDPVPVVDTGWSLLALMVDPAVVGRTEGIVLTFPITASRSAILVRAPSYLDRTRVRTCYAAACGEEPAHESCTERQPERPVPHLQAHFEVDRVERVIPGETLSYQPPGQTYCIVFSVPLHTSGSGVPHLVRVSEQWPLRVRITRVNGVDFEGQLPGPEVRLLDARESTGSLEVEVSSDGLGPDSDWLTDPPLVEVTGANEHLLEPFRSQRTSRF